MVDIDEKIIKEGHLLKFMEGCAFEIAQAISEFYKDVKEMQEQLDTNLAFCLFVVDRTSGKVKYISDIKNNTAVIAMIENLLSDRKSKLEAAQNVTGIDLEKLPTKDTKPN